MVAFDDKERYYEIESITNKKDLLKYIKINEKVLTSFDWLVITKLSCFSLDLIEKYEEYVDWIWICSSYMLSEKQIKNNLAYVDWYGISAFQDLSWEFIDEFKDQLSIDVLLLNENLRSKPYFTSIEALYQETKKLTKYRKTWKKNLNNSMFRPTKKLELAEAGTLSNTLWMTPPNLDSMSKQEMKDLLTQRDVKTFYHDTLEILKQKIRSSDKS